MVKNKKILVAYFSHTGRTKKVAKEIATKMRADIFEVEAIKKYPMKFKDVVKVAKNELDENCRPKLKNKIDNISSYDTIYIGYPNWWETMPMPIFTFLESYDFSGKTIIPFCTHEGSGLGISEKDINYVCPNSNTLQGIAISKDKIKNSEEIMNSFVN